MDSSCRQSLVDLKPLGLLKKLEIFKSVINYLVEFGAKLKIAQIQKMFQNLFALY